MRFGKYSSAVGFEPIHNWFNLTYAQYLTMPRSLLQSMPVNWQRRFVKCLEEFDDHFDWLPESGCYWVKLKDGKGRYAHDPFMDYERGRKKWTPEQVKALRHDEQNNS